MIMSGIIVVIGFIVAINQRDSAKKEIRNFQQQAVEKGFAGFVEKTKNLNFK